MVTQPRERLIEQGSDRVVLELVAPKELVYFDGHFDGRPVLAGVVQVDWVIACGRRYFDLPPQFRGMQALKFQRIITPETPVTLELSFERAKAALAFKITSLAGAHANGRILFSAGDV